MTCDYCGAAVLPAGGEWVCSRSPTCDARSPACPRTGSPCGPLADSGLRRLQDEAWAGLGAAQPGVGKTARKLVKIAAGATARQLDRQKCRLLLIHFAKMRGKQVNDTRTAAQEFQAGTARTECCQTKARRRFYGAFPEPFGDTEACPNGDPVNALVRLNHSVIGMLNELGEISSMVQKIVYYGNLELTPEVKLRMQDEYGDLLYHFCQGLNALGLDTEEVMGGNRAKLKIRYPNAGWEADRAVESGRDRVAEAEAVGGGKKLGRPRKPKAETGG